MSNDVIAFACRQCGKKMKVNSSLAGKAAKCPGCGAQLRIPVPSRDQASQHQAVSSGSVSSGSVPSGSVPSASGASSRSAAQANSQSPRAAAATVPPSREFGLDGITREDPFAGAGQAPANPRQNPLANHVVADPGFAMGQAPVKVRKPEDDEPTFARNPLIVEMETEQAKQQELHETLTALKAKADKAAANPMKSVPVLIGVLAGVPLFFALVFGFTFDAKVAMWIAIAVNILLGPAAIGVQIWGIIKVAMHEGENKVLQLLLFILVPLYNLIYSIMNWQVMKGYFGALIVIAVMSGAGSAIMMVMIAKIAATTPSPGI